MSYIRGKYYTYHGGQMYMFGLGDVPLSIVDEYVVMRYAEMSKPLKDRAEKRAMKKYQGNFGCDALLRKYGKETAMDKLNKAKGGE